jgi:hypothetical protein
VQIAFTPIRFSVSDFRPPKCAFCLGFILAVCVPAAIAAPPEPPESLWVEAESLDGIRGYCWPMGRPEMKKTTGNWGLSGPGWAAEWNMGGESGFLSIATAADDDKAVATTSIEVPADGTYAVWVRYGDWREASERFQIKLEQDGSPPSIGRYGEKPMVDEDNEMKLYWGWVFTWDKREAKLKKGPARLGLVSTTKEPVPRQVDVIVLTTDPTYRPYIKERPKSFTREVLESYRGGVPSDLEPLARNRPAPDLPPPWKLRTFRDKGFVYLWNVSATEAPKTWLSDKPDRVKVPYNVNDEETRKQFEKKYAGRDDVPIFSDPRLVPTFHGSGPAVFATDDKTGEVQEPGRRLAQWLDTHPDRFWGMMMNYAPEKLIGPKGIEMFTKYRNRYVGSIAGESLGYFYPDAAAMQQATAGAKTRRELAQAFTPVTLASNTAKYRRIFGRDLDRNPYEEVIPCQSVGNIAFLPLCSLWGARTIGYESSAMTSSMIPMRWAFLRGTARQGQHLTATYRSCNFGDSATIFSNGGSFHTPQSIFDNYYSVYSGAGMTWYKFDIWYQYMCGSSMFYHEQGFDEYWRPGGTSAAGVREVELSPKGKLVDRFLRLTAAEPDRGHPYTPVAFLVDYAHGWEPGTNWPNAFDNWHGHQDRFRYGIHERMLEEYFSTAYFPIAAESEKPITGTNETYLAGPFGDIFDVISAYPDVKRWTTIDTYPVVVAAGEIELTAAEGQRLAQYMANGGTLLVADAHLSGPGVAALGLPATGAVEEAGAYRWLGEADIHGSQRFRLKPIQGIGSPAGKLPAGAQAPAARALATTPDGKCFCAAFERGRGRLVYLAVPHAMGLDRRAIPVLPRLMAHLTRGLMPVEVSGEVEWLVNRTSGGWAVTLLNPAGQKKPQQGITPTDFRENRRVTIRARVPIQSARDRLLPADVLPVRQNTVECEVPAGALRIVELR